jgi:hypothetical protein
VGNQNLTPRKPIHVTAGFVVEPQKTGLQFSVDAYDIDLADASVSSACNASSTSAAWPRAASFAATCSATGTNAVTAVFQPVAEHQQRAVRGVDYELLWNKDTDWFGNRDEALTLRFLAGRLLEDSTTTPGGQPVDCRASSARPENRAWRRCAISSAVGLQLAAALLRRERDQRRHDHVRAVRDRA